MTRTGRTMPRTAPRWLLGFAPKGSTSCDAGAISPNRGPPRGCRPWLFLSAHLCRDLAYERWPPRALPQNFVYLLDQLVELLAGLVGFFLRFLRRALCVFCLSFGIREIGLERIDARLERACGFRNESRARLLGKFVSYGRTARAEPEKIQFSRSLHWRPECRDDRRQCCGSASCARRPGSEICRYGVADHPTFYVSHDTLALFGRGRNAQELERRPHRARVRWRGPCRGSARNKGGLA